MIKACIKEVARVWAQLMDPSGLGNVQRTFKKKDVIYKNLTIAGQHLCHSTLVDIQQIYKFTK